MLRVAVADHEHPHKNRLESRQDFCEAWPIQSR